MDHGEIRVGIGSDYSSRIFRRVVRELDLDAGGFIHHVVIGQDIAVLIDDYPRPERSAGGILRFAERHRPAPSATEKLAEKSLHAVVIRLIFILLGLLPTPQVRVLPGRYRYLFGDVFRGNINDRG